MALLPTTTTVSIAISEIFSVKEWPEPGLGLFKVIDNGAVQ